MLIAYTPFGFNLPTPGTGALGFNGYTFDHTIMGYLLGNGYRHYSPSQQRFFSPDLLSPFDEGGINAYAYCSGDPQNLSDPSGHAFFSSAIKGVQNLLNMRKSSAKILTKLNRKGVTVRLNAESSLNVKLSLDTPTSKLPELNILGEVDTVPTGIMDARKLNADSFKITNENVQANGTMGIDKKQLRDIYRATEKRKRINMTTMRNLETNLKTVEKSRAALAVAPPSERTPRWKTELIRSS